jgi:hypothetical protein
VTACPIQVPWGWVFARCECRCQCEARVARGERRGTGLPRVAGRAAARSACAAGPLGRCVCPLGFAGVLRPWPTLAGVARGPLRHPYDLSGRRFGSSVHSSYLGDILVEILPCSRREATSAPRSGQRTQKRQAHQKRSARPERGRRQGLRRARAGWRGASGTGSPITCFFPSSRYFVRLSSTNGRVAPSASRTCAWKARTSGSLKWFTGSPP